MIALDAVGAGYGERTALHGLTCTLRRGRTTAVLGPGASGKSTLLRRLAGADLGPGAWSTGAVRGAPAPVSWLPQQPDPAELRATLRALLERDGPADLALERAWRGSPAADVVRPLLDVPLAAVSPTLRRLARLTAALARPARLVLLDEPEAGAAPREQAWIRGALAALRGRRTVVLVTHSLELAWMVSDDALFLLDGVLIEAATTPTLFTAPTHPRTRDLIADGA